MRLGGLATVAFVVALTTGWYGTSRPLPAQEADDSGVTFRDSTAERLYEAAVANRLLVHDAVVRYQALVRQRLGVRLRTPLKDRTLYRAEAADRVWWARDGQTVIHVLGLREQTPLGVARNPDPLDFFDDVFDPTNDRLFLGVVGGEDDPTRHGRNDFWFEHPLDGAYRGDYRFGIGDTITLSLPDGRRIRAVELRVTPRVADVHRISGSLWIEPATGSLVRAVYRLSAPVDAIRDIADLQREDRRGNFKDVPPMFKPWHLDLTMIAVEYGLWDGSVWMPRSLHAEGLATAGVLEGPAALDISYRIESVLTDADVAEGKADAAAAEVETPEAALDSLRAEGGRSRTSYHVRSGWLHSGQGSRRRTVRYVVPRDTDALLDSPQLPPPVWDDAPGFVSQDELEHLLKGMSALPAPPLQDTPATFAWGPQRPDLIRYNRVEGLSVGVREEVRANSFLGPLSVTSTARLGTADLEPEGRLDVARDGLRRRVSLSAFHELAEVSEGARDLELGNSVLAAVVGRDDGDYYLRSGGWLEWSPSSVRRPSFRVRAYAEYQQPVRVRTHFSLLHPRSDPGTFRPNLQAAEGWELGGLVALTPWWGSNPDAAQGGVSATLRAAGGDFPYARASVGGKLALPFPHSLRLGLAAGGGTSWGSPPPQRRWLIGGPATLRGYAPGSLSGTSYLRGRVELARRVSFGALSTFSDIAWAGDRSRVRLADALVSAGAGISLLDGLVRVDAAWGLREPRGFRLEAYLDGIL